MSTITTKRPTVAVVVLDAVGVNTLQTYLTQSMTSIKFPNLSRLGLGNLLEPKHHEIIEPSQESDLVLAASPASVWSDSVMGHRELMGYIDPNNYQLFREGFPSAFVEELERRTKRPVLYNKRAGGMEAIEENHAQHMNTGGVILYASMCDPIAQLAACEAKISPDDLESIAHAAFTLAQESGVRLTRVITRPYVRKEDGTFARTANRKDVVLQLPEGVPTLIGIARAYGIHTVSIGKSADVVNTTWDTDRSLKGFLPPELKFMYTMGKSDDKNPYSMRELLLTLQDAHRSGRPTFVLCNLPDTDSLYGHTRQSEGSLQSLMAFDAAIPLIEKTMPHGVLLITADHGMKDGGDYGYHSREAVPVVGTSVNGPRIKEMMDIPKAAPTYAIVGQICAKIMGFETEFTEKCITPEKN